MGRGRGSGEPGGAPEAVRERGAPRMFRVLLALFVLVAVAKVHEAVPQLGIVPWVKVSGAALVAAAVTALPAARFRAMLRTPTAHWLLLIVGLALAGVPFALWKWQSANFLLTNFWKPLVLFVVAASAFADPKTMRAATVAFLVGAGVAALRVASGVATSALEGGAARFSVGGTFDPNESALLFLVAIPFALELAAEQGKGRLRWYLVALLLVAGVVRTGSRAGFLGLCAVAMWWLWRAMTSRRRARTLVVLFGAGAVFGLTATPQLRERFSSVFNLEQDYNFTSREGRWQIWQRGVRYMVTHPALGVGIANFSIAEGDLSGKANEGYGIKYSAAHNSFIEIGAELGILGLIAFIGMLWTAYQGCRRLRRYRAGTLPGQLMALSWATEGALLAFVVTGSFLSFAYQMVTYFLLAMAVGVRLAARAWMPVDPVQGRSTTRAERLRGGRLAGWEPAVVPGRRRR